MSDYKVRPLNDYKFDVVKEPSSRSIKNTYVFDMEYQSLYSSEEVGHQYIVPIFRAGKTLEQTQKYLVSVTRFLSYFDHQGLSRIERQFNEKSELIKCVTELTELDSFSESIAWLKREGIIPSPSGEFELYSFSIHFYDSNGDAYPVDYDFYCRENN